MKAKLGKQQDEKGMETEEGTRKVLNTGMNNFNHAATMLINYVRIDGRAAQCHFLNLTSTYHAPTMCHTLIIQ